MAARRTWFAWHSWTGLTAGLLLFVICWSGTVAVFSREIDSLLDPALSAPVHDAPVAWEAVHREIRRAYPGWEIGQINGPPEPGLAAETWATDPDEVTHRLFSDPATGGLLAARSYFNVQRFFRSFHMSLFIGDLPVAGIPLGYLIVGLVSFPLLISVATSLVFYRRFWRGFFKLQLRKGARVFWSDAHKLTGLWGLWFALLIGLTGVWYLAEWKTPEGPAPPKIAAAPKSPPLPVGMLVAAAQSAYPELRIKVVALHDYDKGLLEVQGQDGAWLVRDRAAKAWVDSRTGRPAGIQRPSDLTAYQRWIDTADPLHFGNFGGLWSKSVWFLFGLALSGLCLTGAYLQAKRQQRRGAADHRRIVALSYLATTALLLLSAWHGWRELQTYGSAGRLPAVLPAQTAFIAAWTASTLAALGLWMKAVR